MTLATEKQTMVERAKLVSGEPINCEICNKDIALPHVHSFVISYALCGKVDDETQVASTQMRPPYQCETEQHFCCSYEHATLAGIACMLHHMHDDRHAGYADDLAEPTLKEISDLVYDFIEKERGVA